MGLERSISSACVFKHPQKQLMCSVHGDDFATVGPKKSLHWFKDELTKRYGLKEAARIGGGATNDIEGRVLNRIVAASRGCLTLCSRG